MNERLIFDQPAQNESMVSDIQREQRRQAGKKSGEVRGGRAESIRSVSGSAPDLGNLSADIKRRMDSYVQLAGDPVSWPDIKNYEQVIEQMIINERRQLDLAQSRGELFTSAQIQARDEASDELILSHLDAFVAYVGTLVPPERKTDVCARTREWLDQTKGEISVALRARR